MTQKSLLEHFKAVEDPRQIWKIDHQLFDIIFLTVTAVIAGAESWEEIQDFGEMRLDWLKQYGDFSNGVPSQFTIARVIGRIDPEQFQMCFMSWMEDCQALTKGRVVSVDGKTVRSSYGKRDDRSAIHMVSAFCNKNNQILGQLKTHEKSNEITVIPELLALLDLSGCLVTLDAMGCQTKIAEAILDKDADYLLAVKGNQGRLLKAFENKLGLSEIQQMDEDQLDLYDTFETGRGRKETRQYLLFDPFEEFVDLAFEWPRLTKLGVVISTRGKRSEEHTTLSIRYYITSADLTAQEFGEAVRSHWGIENKLHWMLDVGMKEDACQVYRDNAAENLSGARRIALNLLKRETSKKISIQRKQKMTAMDPDFMSRVLDGY